MTRPVVSSIDHAGSWALTQLSTDGGRIVPALVAHDRALDLSDRPEVGSPRSTLDLLAHWYATEEVLAALAADATAPWRPLAEFRIHAPVDPPQVFQCGANYRTHVIDMTVAYHDGTDGRAEEQVRTEAAAQIENRLQRDPYVFTGLPSAVCGAYDDVVLPFDGQKPDFELELAAVIGRRARRLSPDEALDAVAGWVIVNDLTLRERFLSTDYPEMGSDWLAAKNSPTFLPCGPVLVPRSAVPDASGMRLTLRLNDEVMQDETTKDMIFDVARVVAHCSKVATLLPGDLVLTGSPAGNGIFHGRLLRPGDRMDATITGLGAQSNACVSEK
ncbi:fumarylacetoacetate hydrolase family protein [Streptomyces sp. NPDC090499]|uniref:fumarylacetoacetate hydrolase family protein n=1 Tax=Streptomyces sp. NPDC090499 TaxID=3365965 RepID=UPI0038280656